MIVNLCSVRIGFIPQGTVGNRLWPELLVGSKSKPLQITTPLITQPLSGSIK